MIKAVRKKRMGPVKCISSNLTLYNTMMMARYHNMTISQILVCEIRDFPRPDHFVSKDHIICLMTPSSPPSSPLSSVDIVDLEEEEDRIRNRHKRNV
jgi:hypothetical protein